MFKKVVIIIILIFSIFILMNNISATTYTVSNSTDSNTISKMISGDVPFKNGKIIRNGDIVRLKAGNYYNINLVVDKRISIVSAKNAKNKVNFIGRYKNNNLSKNSSAIFLNSNKVKIKWINIKNYKYGIFLNSSANSISNVILRKNTQGIFLNNAKNKIFYSTLINSGIYIENNFNKIYSNKFRDAKIYINGLSNKIQKNRAYNTTLTINGNKNNLLYSA